MYHSFDSAFFYVFVEWVLKCSLSNIQFTAYLTFWLRHHQDFDRLVLTCWPSVSILAREEKGTVLFYHQNSNTTEVLESNWGFNRWTNSFWAWSTLQGDIGPRSNFPARKFWGSDTEIYLWKSKLWLHRTKNTNYPFQCLIKVVKNQIIFRIV